MIVIPIVIYKHKIIMYASKLKQVVIKFTPGTSTIFHVNLDLNKAIAFSSSA